MSYENVFNGANRDLMGWAQRKVQRAVREGKLERGACAVCGEANVHGHHEDYAKPMDVTWLCPLHHRHRHRYGDGLGIFADVEVAA